MHRWHLENNSFLTLERTRHKAHHNCYVCSRCRAICAIPCLHRNRPRDSDMRKHFRSIWGHALQYGERDPRTPPKYKQNRELGHTKTFRPKVNHVSQGVGRNCKTIPLCKQNHRFGQTNICLPNLCHTFHDARKQAKK